MWLGISQSIWYMYNSAIYVLLCYVMAV